MIVDQIVGIIGWPVGHSISPAMHNRAFLELGLLNWLYVPMPVSQYPEIRVKEAILGLRALGFRGANVTVPYKEAVLPYLDQLSDMAEAIGAVNTIVVDSEGRLVGHNTDGLGFIEDLADHEISYSEMRILILGAGGSARAVVHALLSHGCRNITILNRTQTKADDIATNFRDCFQGATIDTGPLDQHYIKQAPLYDLVINATSIGLKDSFHEMPWSENLHFVSEQIVYDLIYRPTKTAFLSHAAKAGAQTINGLGMLVHQGALAFEIWTGQKAPVEVMRKAALEVASKPVLRC